MISKGLCFVLSILLVVGQASELPYLEFFEDFQPSDDVENDYEPPLESTAWPCVSKRPLFYSLFLEKWSGRSNVSSKH